MTDPITALGAAAAASQLVAQALSITIYFYQSFAKIKEAPESVRKALAEVEQLISISKLIIQSPSYQVDSVASTLRSCLQNTTRLQALLQNVSPGNDSGKIERLKKAFVSVLKQDDVKRLFEKLDREKMDLLLCMHQTDS